MGNLQLAMLRTWGSTLSIVSFMQHRFLKRRLQVGAVATRSEGWLHVAEIDVHPDWQRKGIGRRLMQRLLDEARTRVLKGGTLTTDRWAAFNAPFYLSLGFRFVHPQDATPNLQLVLDEEAAAGLNPGRRVAMVISFDESQK